MPVNPYEPDGVSPMSDLRVSLAKMAAVRERGHLSLPPDRVEGAMSEAFP